MFEEKLREAEELLTKVPPNVAKEYRTIIADIQREMNSEIEKAAALRDMKFESLKHKLEAGQQALKQNLEVNCINNYC